MDRNVKLGPHTCAATNEKPPYKASMPSGSAVYNKGLIGPVRADIDLVIDLHLQYVQEDLSSCYMARVSKKNGVKVILRILELRLFVIMLLVFFL